MNRLVAAAILTFCAAGSVFAQVPLPDPTKLTPAERDGVIRGALSRAPDPTDGPAISAAGPKAVFEATTKDKVATARIAHIWNNLRVEGVFRGKVDESDEITELADLDGIRNKSSVKGSVMYTRWGVNPASLVTGPCTRYRIEVEVKRRREIALEVRAANRRQLEEAFPPPVRDEPGFDERWKALEADLEGALPQEVGKRVTAAPPITCSLIMLRNLAREAAAKAAPGSSAAAEAEREIVELGRLLDPGSIWFFGGDVSIAPESFEFVTLGDTVEDGKEEHTSRSFTARASLLTRQNVTYTAAFTFEKAWQAGTETQLCRPEGPEGVESCAKAIVGAPAEKDARKATLSLRWFPISRFAMDIRVNHDFGQDETGIEFPIYFLQSPEGGLAGGVNLGYHVDKKEFTAVLFVGGLSTLIPQ